MSDMFGAPIGISAAEQDMRQGALGGLQAQKLLGEIAEQPDRARLTRAHADLYSAQAAEHSANALDQQKLAELATTMAAQGRVATVEDLGPKTPRSGADYLEQFAGLASDKGVSVKTTAGLYEKAAVLRQREAAAGASAATEVVKKLDAQAKRATRVGELATAALQGQLQYDQARMLAAQEGLPIDRLPQDLESARPLLQGLITSSMTAKDGLELKRKEAHDKAQETLWRSTEAKNTATSKTAAARTELISERTKLLRKNGGEGSPQQQAARAELTASRKALREARERKEFPALPLDPKSAAFVPGKTFTDRQGRRLAYVGRDAAGLPTFELAPKGSAAAAPAGDEAALIDEGDESAD